MVTGTGRASACQAASESRPVKARRHSAAVGGLPQDHRHVGLLVDPETAVELPAPVTSATTGTSSRALAQRRHRAQIGVRRCRRVAAREPLPQRTAEA